MVQLLSNKNAKAFFEDEVLSFMETLQEKFYFTKELLLEELLPFIFEYNSSMRDLVQSITEYSSERLDQDFLLKLYSTHLLAVHSFHSNVSKDSNQEIKFFTKEDQFIKSQ